MILSLRPKINYQLFHTALLQVHGNAQLMLCCLVPYLICTCPIPSWSHPSLGSSWCDRTAQQLCCHVGIHPTTLGCKASVKDARPLIWAPLPQQAQECQCPCLSVWDLAASSRRLSTTSWGSHCQCFLGQAIKAWGLCSNLSGHESNGPRNESITLSIRFNIPMEMTYICISSHYLKLVSGVCFPLACAPSLCTEDKSASFPSLCCARCSQSLQARTYSRTKRHWGIFWIRQEYAFPWMLWITLKIFIFANCLCAFYPLT